MRTGGEWGAVRQPCWGGEDRDIADELHLPFGAFRHMTLSWLDKAYGVFAQPGHDPVGQRGQGGSVHVR